MEYGIWIESLLDGRGLWCDELQAERYDRCLVDGEDEAAPDPGHDQSWAQSSQGSGLSQRLSQDE